MPTVRINDGVRRGKNADDIRKYARSVGGDPEDLGVEVLIRDVGRTMQQERNAGWVTDVSKMSRVLDRTVDAILSHKEAIDGKKSRSARTFNMALVNTAYTVLSDGTKFRYFDAVDRGRKAIRPKNGKRIVFITNQPNDNNHDLDINGEARIIGQNIVRGTKPAYITAKSLGESKVAVPLNMERELRKFAEDMSNYADGIGPSVPRDLGFVNKETGKYTIDQYEIVGTKSSRSKDELYRVKRSRADERARRAEKKRLGYNTDRQTVRKRDKGEKSAGVRESEVLKQAGLFSQGKYEYKPHIYTVIPRVVIRYLDELESNGGAELDDDVVDSLAEERFLSSLEDYDVGAERLAARNIGAVKLTREQYEKELEKEAYDFARDQVRLIQQINADAKKTANSIEKVHNKVRSDFAVYSVAGLSASQQLIGFFRNLAYGASTYGGQILEVEGDDPRGPAFRSKKAQAERLSINQARGAVLTALTQFTNATQIVRYFMRAVRPTIEIFRKNTPTRTGYKLMSDGSVLTPSTGKNDFLRNRYEFVATGRLAKLLREYTSQ